MSSRPLLLITLALAALAGAAYKFWPQPPAAPVPVAAVTPPPPAPDLEQWQAKLNAGALTAEQRQVLMRQLPAIMHENGLIAANRLRLENIAQTYLREGDISEADFNWVKALAIEYHLKPMQRSDNHFFTDLLSRVDVVPASLTLAQLALSTGQGRSPYTGPGIGCPSEGCRAEDTSTFAFQPDSDAELVHELMHRVNTQPTYIELRDLRVVQRSHAESPKGMTLVDGLRNEELPGSRHVDEVRTLIQINHLDELD